MERTKYNGKKTMTKTVQLQGLQAVVTRMMLASQLGMQYNGNRDIYQALGYKVDINWDDYYNKYRRQDIAKAIIDRPVKSTWQGPLLLVESDKSDDTAFEKAWKDLDRKLGLKSRLARVDRLTGIGRYGVLLLGLDDVRNADGFAKPVGTVSKLLYVKPFGEKTALIDTYEPDPTNERYGLPLLYSIQIVDAASSKSMTVKVHYSRIIHIVDEPLESEVFGTPRLEAVFNRLYDMDKLIGGDAEMFWRGARPGYSGKLDPDYQATQQTKDDLKDQITEYENDLRRILISEGIDLKALAQQIADPAPHVDVIIKMISAVTGIPMRILTGSERGELASTQDTNEWKEYVQARREDHAEPHILRLLVDRLVELNLMPAPANDYYVKWSELYSQSEKSKVEIGKARANALREYTSNPIAQAIIPPKVFNEFFLGFDDEQITLINKMRDEEISEEELSKAIMDGINPPVPAAVGPNGKPVGKPIDKENTPSKAKTVKVPA